MRLRSWRVGSARAVGSTVSAARGESAASHRGPRLQPEFHHGLLVSCNSDSSHNSRAGHPGWLRCSSLTYSRYARSSRLAIRAPRSGTYATNHCYRTLAAHDKVWLHSTADASSRAELLLVQIFPIFSVVAPCPRGASAVSVRRQTFTTGC